MLSHFIVVTTPSLQSEACIVNAFEPARIWIIVAQTPVERLDVSVVDRLAGSDEVDIDLAQVRPGIEVIRCEFRSVVDLDRLGRAPRFAMTGSRVSVTAADGRLRAIFNARHSRVKRSITVSTRIFRPSERASETKSMLERSLTRAAAAGRDRVWLANSFRRLIRTVRPSSR